MLCWRKFQHSRHRAIRRSYRALINTRGSTSRKSGGCSVAASLAISNSLESMPTLARSNDFRSRRPCTRIDAAIGFYLTGFGMPLLQLAPGALKKLCPQLPTLQSSIPTRSARSPPQNTFPTRAYLLKPKATAAPSFFTSFLMVMTNPTGALHGYLNKRDTWNSVKPIVSSLRDLPTHPRWNIPPERSELQIRYRRKSPPHPSGCCLGFAMVL